MKKYFLLLFFICLTKAKIEATPFLTTESTEEYSTEFHGVFYAMLLCEEH